MGVADIGLRQPTLDDVFMVLTGHHAEEPAECRAGEVLRGQLKPYECPAFGGRCTPENPLGAPMVSAEGACAAYYNFGRLHVTEVEA